MADKALVERVFAEHGVEAVIHAAALHKPDIARYPAAAFIDTNVGRVLRALRSGEPLPCAHDTGCQAPNESSGIAGPA